MEYRKLPRNGLIVSEIGFGCMSLEEEASRSIKLLRTAFESGINYFDTADLYQHGRNEEIVGSALKPIRQSVIIATKVGNEWNKDGNSWHWNPSKAYILKAVEKSLLRLQTDYIDLYQLHGGTIEDPIDEIIETFEALKQQGTIRAYGISSIRPNVIKEWVRRSKMASVMMQYSLLDKRPEEFCLDFLNDHEIGVMARGVMAKGLLAGKTPADYLKHSAENVRMILQQIGKLPGIMVNGAAIKYVLSNSSLSSAVVGIRNEFQLQEALKANLSRSLTDEELNIIKEQIPAFIYEAHR